MKIHLIVLCTLLLFTGIAKAQKFNSPIKPPLIGLHYTLVDYNSPERIKKTSLDSVFKQGDIFKPGKQAQAFTISYWKGLSKNITISGKFNGIFYSYEARQGRSTPNKEFGAELEAAINFHPLSDAHFFNPFLTAGIGGGHYTDRLGSYIPLGLGFQFNLRSKIYFFLQTQYRATLSKDIFPDNLFHSIGMAVSLLSSKHKAISKNPTAEISDRDHDGVLDRYDECPDIVGLAMLHGCPDRDGDKIADEDDSCIDVPGNKKYHGCPIPDRDKDRVNDDIDKCPDVPGVDRYNGCPIPDTDGDGLNDEEDKCKYEAGPKSNSGCPVIEQEIIEKVNLAAKNIFFETGSFKLLDRSFPSLNNIAQILIDNPLYNADIDGYTDSIGTAEKNLILSQDRANSVKAYLINKGIKESRMRAQGFGLDNPIATNKTASGRTKNRRVEIKLKNY